MSGQVTVSAAIPKWPRLRDTEKEDRGAERHTNVHTSVPACAGYSCQRFRFSDENFDGIRVALEAGHKGFGEYPFDFRRIQGTGPFSRSSERVH